MKTDFETKVQAILGSHTDLRAHEKTVEWPNADEIVEVASDWYDEHGPDAARAVNAADRMARTYPAFSFGRAFWRAVGDSIECAMGDAEAAVAK